MSLVLNNNLMAANTARNLNAHYGRLATSTQRLSSGLRINSAADDAAGLAIRELQRADIAALQQGARNANDAVSMIQVADGSLSVIDEKLIRMRELAEQAATGTYDSTQRMMIESEYQAMASEITRIANATDFNGIKLLDGSLKGEHDGSGLTAKGEMKIHFGTGNDSAEDYYYVEIGEVTSQALGIGNASTWQDVQQRAILAFKSSLSTQIKNDGTLTDQEKVDLLGQVEEQAELLENALKHATDPTTAFLNFTNSADFPGSSTLHDAYMTAVNAAQKEFDGVGWPTTSQEILDKITEAMKSVEGPDYTGLNPGNPEIIDYTAALQEAVQPIAVKYNISPNTTDRIIQNAIDAFTKNNNPPYEKEGLLATLQNTIVSNLNANKTVNDGIANTFDQAISNAIGMVPLPVQPNYDLHLDIYDAKHFQEYKDRVFLAAQNAAKALGLTDMSALDAVMNTVPDPTGTITGAELATWNTKLTTAINTALTTAGTPLRDACIQIGISDFKNGLEGVRENYNYTLAATDDCGGKYKTFAQYRTDVENAAIDAGKATGMHTDKLEALFNKWPLYGPNDPISAQGVEEYLNGQIANVTGKGGTIDNREVLAEVERTAEANLKISNKIRTDFWDVQRNTSQQKFQYAWGQAAISNLANGSGLGKYGLGFEKFTLGEGFENLDEQMATRLDAMLSNAIQNMKKAVGHMDFAGYTIETQEDAQMALEAIEAAIVSKDKIRADLGAMQNRLENTISNLNIMAENLQAAESRISDVDVATEMTNMVRNQILAQAATAMLAQANSLPQMAMQLIGG